jgi:hypothetical protein
MGFVYIEKQGVGEYFEEAFSENYERKLPADLVHFYFRSGFGMMAKFGADF